MINKRSHFSCVLRSDETALSSPHNYVNYRSGPFHITVDPYNQQIIISTYKKWSFLISEIKDAVKFSWGVTPQDIIFSNDTQIIIKYNLEIISEFLATKIEYEN